MSVECVCVCVCVRACARVGGKGFNLFCVEDAYCISAQVTHDAYCTMTGLARVQASITGAERKRT